GQQKLMAGPDTQDGAIVADAADDETARAAVRQALNSPDQFSFRLRQNSLTIAKKTSCRATGHGEKEAGRGQCAIAGPKVRRLTQTEGQGQTRTFPYVLPPTLVTNGSHWVIDRVRSCLLRLVQPLSPLFSRAASGSPADPRRGDKNG